MYFQRLEKIFVGCASFHVSLEENYKLKDQNDLKGALAPDALFVKFESEKQDVSCMQIECSVYRSSVTGEGTPDNCMDLFIKFEGMMYAFDRTRIRYVVSSCPKATDNNSSNKAGTPSTSPRKRQKKGQNVVSVILEGITLNLVDNQSFGIDHLMKCLTEDDPGRSSLSSSGKDLDTSAYAVQSALTKWLSSMDAAVEMVDLVEKGIKPVSEVMNTFGRKQIEMKESLLEGEVEARQAEEAVEERLAQAFERTFESLEYQKDMSQSVKFLTEFVASQKEREVSKHTKLIKRVVPSK